MSAHSFLSFSKSIFFGIAILGSSSIYCQPTSNNQRHEEYNQEDAAKWRDRQAHSQSDWDFKESWRYDRDAFYRGHTQPEAVETEFFHNRPPGVGDMNDNYYKYYYQYYHRPFYDNSSYPDNQYNHNNQNNTYNPNNLQANDNNYPSGNENESRYYPRKFPSYGR